MKFKFIKPECENVGAYGVSNISTGDTVEFSGHFIEKATNNPDFELVKVKAKKAVKKNGDSSGNQR